MPRRPQRQQAHNKYNPPPPLLISRRTTSSVISVQKSLPVTNADDDPNTNSLCSVCGESSPSNIPGVIHEFDVSKSVDAGSMRATAIVFEGDVCLKHSGPPEHPETPARLHGLLEMLKEQNLFCNFTILRPRSARNQYHYTRSKDPLGGREIGDHGYSVVISCAPLDLYTILSLSEKQLLLSCYCVIQKNTNLTSSYCPGLRNCHPLLECAQLRER